MKKLRVASLILGVLPLLGGCAWSQPPATAGISSLFAGHEVAELRVACLLDRGWDVELQDGAIIADFPLEQQSLYQADNEDCLRQAGVDPDAALTDEQYEVIYAWYTQIDDCLDDAGWATPERPSFATFTATYDSDPWIPWIQIPGGETQRAHEACPVMDIPSN